MQVTKVIIVILGILFFISLIFVASSYYDSRLSLKKKPEYTSNPMADDKLSVQQLVDKKTDEISYAQLESNNDIYKRLLGLHFVILVILAIQFFNLTSPEIPSQ